MSKQIYSNEEIIYFVDNYINKSKVVDQSIVLSQLAQEMDRSKGAMAWKKKHALYFLTNGEQGKENGPKFLAEYLDTYMEENNMSKSKMTYWFE